MNWAEITPQIILALIAATPGIIAIIRGRKKEKAEEEKIRADAAKAITEAAGAMLDEYREEVVSLKRLVAQQQEEIRCLEAQVDKQTEKAAEQAVEIKKQKERIDLLEKERREILDGVRALNAQVRNLGQKPVWEPPLK